MRHAFNVDQIRAAESALMATVPAGSLMQRAAARLAQHCEHELSSRTDVRGALVIVLIGSGDNGGDALWAGAILAKRGANVTAIALADQCHEEGKRALVAAGGRVEQLDLDRHVTLVGESALVVDGIVGIGAKGSLRPDAAALAHAAAASGARVVAVDVPSGVDPNTGAITDPTAAINADVTVTFGAIKTGLLALPGAANVGSLRLVDIGLGQTLPSQSTVNVIDRYDVAEVIDRPKPDDDKYTRGVVGVVAGSETYPGAGILCSGAARLGGTGMVRYCGTAFSHVVDEWPDVIFGGTSPAKAGKVQCWVAGSGGGTDNPARERFLETLDADVPVLLDADALTVLAGDTTMHEVVADRNRRGIATLLTPHSGEFARLGFTLAAGADANRISSVVDAARELGAVVLLKGATTLIGTPEGQVIANTHSSSSLATAGSGDVLAGLIGSLLAHQSARADAPLTNTDVARIAACGAWLHGQAGELAAETEKPVTAVDILAGVSESIAQVRKFEV